MIITRLLTRTAKLLSKCHIYLYSITVIILPLLCEGLPLKGNYLSKSNIRKPPKHLPLIWQAKMAILLSYCMCTSLIISFNIDRYIQYFPLLCEFSSHVLTCQSDASNTLCSIHGDYIIFYVKSEEFPARQAKTASLYPESDPEQMFTWQLICNN